MLLPASPGPVPCLGTPCNNTDRPPPQVKAGNDWDRLVASAFASLDPNGDGVLSADELARLLCGEDGCEARRRPLRRPAIPLTLLAGI